MTLCSLVETYETCNAKTFKIESERNIYYQNNKYSLENLQKRDGWYFSDKLI